MRHRTWRALSCVRWPAAVAACAGISGLSHGQSCAMRVFDFAGVRSGATDVSEDGRVMVGWVQTQWSNYVRGVQWTPSGGFTLIGPEIRAPLQMFVSADGTVAAGTGNIYSPELRSFVWASADGVRYLETSPGHRGAIVTDISADGSHVVGYERTADGGYVARLWTTAGGVQSLGTFGGAWSQSTAVSDDGSVVVGFAYNAQGRYRAFRWTIESGMQDLGSLGGPTSRATAVSADGSVVVGYSSDVSGQWRAFRWTSSEGMRNLGTIGGRDARAYAVSADGSVVFGRDRDADENLQIFRWTSEDLIWVGVPGQLYDSRMWASRDGNTVTAFGIDAQRGRQAFRWNVATGTEWLGTVDGVETLPSGISADGRTIVGQTVSPRVDLERAFRWNACPGDFNRDCFVDFFDYADFVTCYEAGPCPEAGGADFNRDGFVDSFDYVDFVQAFETGC